jgi:membrane protease YdiL (CAAX protease family)
VILQSSLIAGALIAAALYKPLHPWQFGLRSTRFWPAVGWSALGLFGFFVFAVIWVALVGTPDQTTVEDVGGDEGQLALILAGVLFIFVAPVAEEFFFRGFFYGSLRTRMNWVWAALVCGTVFGVIHAATGPEAIPVLIVLGAIFCVVREKTGSLYPVIAMHAVNNTIAYAGQSDVAPGIAVGLGVAMLAVIAGVSRVAWRKEPAPA